MRNYPKFYITKKGERAVRGGHPWVYGEEVTRVDGNYANGDLVDVVTDKGKYLGTGFVNDNSKIRVRIRENIWAPVLSMITARSACVSSAPIPMTDLRKRFGNDGCNTR